MRIWLSIGRSATDVEPGPGTFAWFGDEPTSPLFALVEGGYHRHDGHRRELAMAQQQKMTRAEAGRKGGLTTKQRHGEEFFGRIGRIGGKKGGDTTKKRYGVEFYQQIGRKGGSR
jgi:general stress protein YciG